MKIKAFIIAFNRLTSTKAMAEYLADNGCDVELVDNGSTFPKLIEWYKKCPHKVHRLPAAKENAHKTPWTSGIIPSLKDERYIVTDHDLDLSEVPGDFLEVLEKGLENENAIKCGLSLKISDLPKNTLTEQVLKIESNYWKKRDERGYYSAPIDTTLALYHAERAKDFTNETFFRAVRSPEPYTARHLPWYNTPENLTEEERYYLQSIRNTGFWSHEYKRIEENQKGKL